MKITAEAIRPKLTKGLPKGEVIGLITYDGKFPVEPTLLTINEALHLISTLAQAIVHAGV